MDQAVGVQPISCSFATLVSSSPSGDTLTIKRQQGDYVFVFEVGQADRATAASWFTGEEVAICINGSIIKHIELDEQAGVARIQ